MTITAVMFGVGAWYFKKIKQTWYGWSELVFAVLYAVKQSDGLKADNPSNWAIWVILRGAMYVPARSEQYRRWMGGGGQNKTAPARENENCPLI